MSGDSRLVAFLRGTGTDHRGRTIAAVQCFSHAELESHHDFIQWLFPLPEPSPVNPEAPVLMEADAVAVQGDPELRAAVERSFAVTLDFYGFVLRGDQAKLKVDRAPHWRNASANWLTPRNHNFLRLTRIMRSMRLLGFPSHAEALGAALEEVYTDAPEVVGRTTIGYWRDARR